MQPSDFFKTEQDPAWSVNGDPWSSWKDHFDTELVVGLRNGPSPDGTTDLDVAQGLTRLVHAELEEYGTSKAVRLQEDEIAEALRSLKAVLRRLGIPFSPPFRDFRSFQGYWSRNDMGGSWAARRGYLNELFSPIWASLDELDAAGAEASGIRGVDGGLKNIVFASTGHKPEIVMSHLIDGAVEIVEHADSCLVYDRPLTDAGLTWGDLVDWWRAETGMNGAAERDVARSLYQRLHASLASEAERFVFFAFASRYADPDGMSQPALLPQVYVHFDPLTRRHREILSKPRRLARERMDFLLLLPGGVRIVIEVDGKHHYAREVPKGSGCWVAAPDLYSEMVAEDRALRLKGYEVFRFGGKELLEARDDLRFIRQFFTDMEARFWAAGRGAGR
ncbi:hypothetical protein ACFZAG_27295 [Streptomyces sp. NPDC012403]|uniref:AbiJ-NTD3 domain-containing protein n=1 Tax=Streptomyces gancidicus BKS 13-15 TaxID=1284664 RepID=M3E7M2_STREZ|nr:hypothetical protein [Streptomyces gancidicus]EMF29732.1 hypothetical protein H114_07561 [Streptomyces gancidicus BKS 13-15]